MFFFYILKEQRYKAVAIGYFSLTVDMRFSFHVCKLSVIWILPIHFVLFGKVPELFQDSSCGKKKEVPWADEIYCVMFTKKNTQAREIAPFRSVKLWWWHCVEILLFKIVMHSQRTQFHDEYGKRKMKYPRQTYNFIYKQQAW